MLLVPVNLFVYWPEMNSMSCRLLCLCSVKRHTAGYLLCSVKRHTAGYSGCSVKRHTAGLLSLLINGVRGAAGLGSGF